MGSKQHNIRTGYVVDNEGISGTLLSRTQGDNNLILIKNNTKKGYLEATEGDGVYINRPHQKRGFVQKGMIQTIKANSNDIGVVVIDEFKK